MRRALPGWRKALGIAAIAFAGLFSLPFAATAEAAHPGHASEPAAARAVSSSCPAGSTCVTIPADCPKGKICPEVIASPTTNLGTNQSVYLDFEHFKPTDSLNLNYCENTAALSKSPPLCDVDTLNSILPNPQVVIRPYANGTSKYAFEVLEWENDGNTALRALIPGDTTSPTGAMFCDDGHHPCSIDVTVPQLSGQQGVAIPAPSNTAVIPVSFLPQSNGCRRAAFVNTESDFGIEGLFPTAARLNCTGAHPIVGINSTVDSLSAITALAGGAVQVAFTDSPDSSDEQQALAQLQGKVSYIPIALSANVVGFRAVMDYIDEFPDHSYRLTPTEVAGLLSHYWTYPGGAGGGADVVAHCPKGFFSPCSLIYALNYQNGFTMPGVFGGFDRSDPTSSTGELFAWLCAAPNVPIKFDGTTIHDPHTVNDVFKAVWKANSTTYKGCPATTDTFPDFTFEGPEEFSTPVQEAGHLDGLVGPPNLMTYPTAGFASMNWYEANFYGLDEAALENAAGKFVEPTTTSIDAAVSQMKPGPNGTLIPNYTTTDPAAYPMPDLTYAVVPKSITTTEAASIRTLLTDLLALTGGKEDGSLPAGVVPLPKHLYDEAMADVSKDVVAPSKTTPTTTTTTPTTTLPTPTAGQTGLSGPTGSVGPSHGRTGSNGSGNAHTGTTVPATTAPQASKAVQVSPRLVSFAIAGHDLGWLVPTFVCLAAAAILLGPGILLKTRRKRPAAE